MTGGGGPAAARATRIPLDAARERMQECVISVPASSANLGPGFDTLAVALRLYLHVRVCAVLDGPANGLAFDLCGMRLEGENLVERSFRTLAVHEGIEFPSLSLELTSEIPVKGGLGSSAAATVAGLLLYERLAGPGPGRDLLALATRLDEHADNVAAALLGGLVTTCVRDDGGVIARSVPWPEWVQLVVASPAVELSTTDSRRVLPHVLSRDDAVFNLQRAVLLVQALEHGSAASLREALRDRWHQPYRAALVPAFSDLLALEHPNLLGVCLSGSGPAVLALCAGKAEEIAALVRGVYERLAVPCVVRAVAIHQPGMRP